MVASPTCAVCGTVLRWFPEQHGWGCDRCRTITPAAPPPPMQMPMPMPAQPQMPMQAPMPAAARPNRKALYAGLGIGAVAIAGIGIAVAVGGGSGGMGSKDELVRAAIAATNARDVERLVELGAADTLLDAVSCSGAKGGNGYGGMPDADLIRRDMRKEFRDALDDAKKLPALEVIAIENREEPELVVHEGKPVMDGCVGKFDVTEYRLKVTVRATVGGKSHDSTIKMKAMDVGGRWTLSGAPDLSEVSAGGAVDDALEAYQGFRDRACACKDAACTTKVNDDMTAWSSKMAASLGDVKPSEAQMKKMAEVAEQLGGCLAKTQP